MEYVDSTREDALTRRYALAHLIPFLTQQSCAALQQANHYAQRLVSWTKQSPFTVSLTHSLSQGTSIRRIHKQIHTNNDDECVDAIIVCHGDGNQHDKQQSAAAAEVASDCVDYTAVLLASQLGELISHIAPPYDHCIDMLQTMFARVDAHIVDDQYRAQSQHLTRHIERLEQTPTEDPTASTTPPLLPYYTAGCSALIAIIARMRIIIAHVGNIRAYVYEQDTATAKHVPITHDDNITSDVDDAENCTNDVRRVIFAQTYNQRVTHAIGMAHAKHRVLADESHRIFADCSVFIEPLAHGAITRIIIVPESTATSATFTLAQIKASLLDLAQTTTNQIDDISNDDADMDDDDDDDDEQQTCENTNQTLNVNSIDLSSQLDDDNNNSHNNNTSDNTSCISSNTSTSTSSLTGNQLAHALLQRCLHGRNMSLMMNNDTNNHNGEDEKYNNHHHHNNNNYYNNNCGAAIIITTAPSL